MKVLFVNLVYGTGSTGKIIADIMNLLKKYGNDVKTLYGTGACSDNADTVKVSGKLEYYFHNAVSRFTHTQLNFAVSCACKARLRIPS